jgi:hypothetical protein
VLDQSRDALAFVTGSMARPQNIQIQTVHQNLAAFALGRKPPNLAPADLILAHGLLEYLPEPLAMTMVRVLRGHLAPGGAVVATALAPSADASLLDRLLGWPTVRRTAEALHTVFTSGGYRLDALDQPSEAALLAIGRSHAQQEQRAS